MSASQVKPDPKPARRTSDPKLLRSLHLHADRCRACGCRKQLTLHHLVPRGQRGDDVKANLIFLCGSGTSGCHGALTAHRNASWPSQLAGKPWQVVASRIRRTLRLSEVDYVLAKKGQAWLERTLPL